eukprot:snap_masked-scaffold_5-processed-gene-10.37-mRNA-1 protein AED:1.00 eAED:1.00 QI:0/0/0/0/1/1/2/0/65
MRNLGLMNVNFPRGLLVIPAMKLASLTHSRILEYRFSRRICLKLGVAGFLESNLYLRCAYTTKIF